MIVLGIDPGLSGALAFVDTARQKVIAVYDMPVMRSGKTANVTAGPIADWVREHKPEHVIVEQVQAMGTGEGRASLFKFGAAYGVVLGAIQVLGLPYTLVTPAKWKRQAGLIGKSKDASHALACKLFPGATRMLFGPRGGALIDHAEALLLTRVTI